MRRYEHKVAIITGAASGIGAAIADRFASEGASLVVADLKPPDARGENILFQRTDVSSPAEIQALVAATMSRFGQLDILVNNAGIGALAETPDMEDSTWDRVLAVNLSSAFYACRAAIPLMRRQGGAIINVASISGLAGDYGMGAYNASKAALINYTRSLALDCARDNIRVNALCPGAIGGTAMGVGAHGSDADRHAWTNAIPMGRLGTASEIASVAAFLASNESSFMTGAVIAVDGGMTAYTGQPNVPAQHQRRRLEQH